MNEEFGFNTYRVPRVCSKCGGELEFKGLGEYQCVSCAALEYDDYGVVRGYLEKNKGATVTEISLATGISQNSINQMLRDNRFQVAGDSRVQIKCKSCGKEIRSGLYCPVCEKLAEAAAAKKKAEQLRKSHHIAGYENTAHKGESGARRFRREDLK